MAITLFDLNNYPGVGTRAGWSAFLLEELGVEWKRQRLDWAAKENRSPDYLAVHPHGLVPAIRDGEVTVFESGAIGLYLADRFRDKGLAPEPGTPGRGRYYQWMVYAVATVEPALAAFFVAAVRTPAEQRDEKAIAAGAERCRVVAEVLNKALDPGPFLLGERFSACDCLIGSMMVWADAMGRLSDHPRLQAYAAAIKSRPAFARANT